MINRKVMFSSISMAVDGTKEKTFTPDMSIRKLGLILSGTYTNGATAVTNSALLSLGMWKINVKINGTVYHVYTPETIIRINEAKGYIPESTDCNAIGSSTAATVYAVFELPVSIVKTDDVKDVTVEVTHQTTGAGVTNAGVMTVPKMDLIVYYDDAVPFTTKFSTITLASASGQEKSLPIEGLLDMITLYGAADYITQVVLTHNQVRVVDLSTWKMYVKERTLRLQGVRKAYGETVDVDNIPVELNTKLNITNSTAQETIVGLLYIAEVDEDIIDELLTKEITNIDKDTISVIATELEEEARIGGLDIPIVYPDHPFGEISM